MDRALDWWRAGEKRSQQITNSMSGTGRLLDTLDTPSPKQGYNI